MIIETSELIHFGGLVKVLTQKPTVNGQLKNSDNPCRLTTNYSIPKLKIYKKVKRYDLINEEYILISESVPVNTYKVEVIHNEPNIFWRQKMWDLAIYRSLEIWKKIPSARIDKSIGELTELARKSLGGKLVVANGTYFKKDA